MPESLSLYAFKKLHVCNFAIADGQTGGWVACSTSEGDFTVIYLKELQKGKIFVLSYGQNKHLNIT